MATTNKRGARTAPQAPALSPVRTVAQDKVTFEGAKAHSRDPRSDLFLLAVSNFYGEDTFYEKATDRNMRFIALVRQVAELDPEWIAGFLPWLRKEANIRTAAIVGAVEAAKVLAKAGQVGTEPGPARRILRETFTRADEPAEALAYWLVNYGRTVPSPIRRAISDGAKAFYTERNAIKWDSDDKPVRMADVIELCHPEPKAPWQSALFKFLLDQRQNRGNPIPDELQMLTSRAAVLALSGEDKGKLIAATGAEPAGIAGLPMLPTSQILEGAGLTWEQVSSWGKMTAKTWEALIPIMGYMALLRNLRNFEQAGISAAAVKLVTDRLSDPAEVAKSRQLPYRFLAAYREAQGAQWAHALEVALTLSTQNIPELPGRTLVLVDTSSSMSSMGFSAKSKMTPMMAGALFGVALGSKNGQADLYGYADGVFAHEVRRGASVLRTAEAFVGRVGEVGHGTQTAESLKTTFNGHDRVIIVTDGQTFGPSRGYYGGDVSSQIPASVPIYAFNIGGYAPAMMETSATRHELGGLTDATFAMIKMVEAGQQANWPWLQS